METERIVDPDIFIEEQFFTGTIYEVLLFSCDTYKTEFSKCINGYLAWKWGIHSKLPLENSFSNMYTSLNFINTDIINVEKNTELIFNYDTNKNIIKLLSNIQFKLIYLQNVILPNMFYIQFNDKGK